ncbi:hypothetical protein [Amphritea balenae]|uniref:PAS domain-containing protein n=1 Tax=Amphritea balenae TaxID=452629 RepID=A0A3P1SSA1_9GAMM|nr:hypothetical protein [Amphritea balenae]RRC99919.1 hypothetical protein EHS89_06765 [Amphritea balenae]GGK75081.1 hypothetical protein GCM10007941_26440 [Amphritea balenae]
MTIKELPDIEKLKIGIVEELHNASSFKSFRSFEVARLMDYWVTGQKQARVKTYDDFIQQFNDEQLLNLMIYRREGEDGLFIMYMGSECQRCLNFEGHNKPFEEGMPPQNQEAVKRLVLHAMDTGVPTYTIKTLKWNNDASILYEALFLPVLAEPGDQRADYLFCPMSFEHLSD